MSDPTSRRPALGFIFVTMLLAMTGVGLLIPVLPKLVVEFQGNDIAMGARAYGWLISIFAVMQFIASPILGALSDRFGRRRIILIATAGSAIDYVIMANAPTLGWLFVARMISGVTAGVLATANAYVVDVTDPTQRAQSFGVINAAFGLGLVLGPALGGFLGDHDLRLPFWFAAASSGLNWLWGCFVLPESLRPEHRRAFDWRRANPIGALAALQRFPAVIGLVGAYFMTYLAQTMMHSTWALYMDARYGWGPKPIGLSLMAAGGLMAIVQVTLVKKLVPVLGDARAVVIGFCIWIAAFAGYGSATQGWMIYVVIVVASIGGISQPALQAYITKHIPPNEQGAVQGVFSGVASLAYIPGPLIATRSFAWGVAATRRVPVPGLAFFEAGLVVAIALVLAWRSFRADRRAAAGVARETGAMA